MFLVTFEDAEGRAAYLPHPVCAWALCVCTLEHVCVCVCVCVCAYQSRRSVLSFVSANVAARLMGGGCSSPVQKHKAFVDLLLGEGILDSAHVLDYYPQPVATTRGELVGKIAIILTLEVKEDRVDEFLAIAVRECSILHCKIAQWWPTVSDAASLLACVCRRKIRAALLPSLDAKGSMLFARVTQRRPTSSFSTKFIRRSRRLHRTVAPIIGKSGMHLRNLGRFAAYRQRSIRC